MNIHLCKQLILIFALMLLTACSGSETDNTPPIVEQKDSTPPVITLNGNIELSLMQGESYEELGASATDETDGEVSVVIDGQVDTSQPGEYIVTYSATDSSSNTASAKRTIIVQPKPAISDEELAKGFVILVNTEKLDFPDNPPVDERNVIIYTDGNFEYNFSISWGDGTFSENVTETITHEYQTDGVYEVTIVGQYPKPVFASCVYFESVLQWGEIKWESLEYAFQSCESSELILATDAPDLSNVDSLEGMFYTSSMSADINHWDVSSITNIDYMFCGASDFDAPLNDWDVSNVKSMSGMFGACDYVNDWDSSPNPDSARTSQFNQDISMWNVSNVTNMSKMFEFAYSFNQDISGWDVSSVTDMSYMFHSAIGFNQDLSNWETHQVTNMQFMFRSATAFDADLSQWDTSNVTNMEAMFANAFSFNHQISDWNVSNVESMDSMFATCDNKYAEDDDLLDCETNSQRVVDVDVSKWDIANVKSMEQMFYDGNLPTANYDAILRAWSMQNVQPNVVFDAGNSQYSSERQTDRDVLTNTNGWTISDAGAVSN